MQINWTSFACGVMCLVSGAVSVMLNDAWWGHAAGAFALVMAGFSFSASLLQPKFVALQKEFDAMQRRWENYQPHQISKAAAEAFRERILAMQRSGEFPNDIRIEIDPEQH